MKKEINCQSKHVSYNNCWLTGIEEKTKLSLLISK